MSTPREVAKKENALLCHSWAGGCFIPFPMDVYLQVNSDEFTGVPGSVHRVRVLDTWCRDVNENLEVGMEGLERGLFRGERRSW